MPILATVNAAIEIAKKVMQATQAIKDADVKLQVAELISQLAELKVESAGLIEENNELKRKLAVEADPPAVKDGLYYRGADGPFCTACWDASRKTVRLTLPPVGKRFQGGFRHLCPVCKVGY